MKRSKIGLVVIASLILNTVFMLHPLSGLEVKAVYPGYNGKILFSMGNNTAQEFYTMNSDGSNKIRLTNNSDVDWIPDWSPDGSKIAFSSQTGGNYEIHTMNADGSNLIRMTNASGMDWRSVWSPDGTKIVFNSNRDGNGEIYAINADGTNETRLTSSAGDDTLPQWSPDGSKVAFQSRRDGNNEVYVMNADGSGQTRMTNSAGDDIYPQWSPNGSKITYLSFRDGNYEVYVMNADGSGQTRMTNSAQFEEAGATIKWSPNGQMISVSRMNLDWDASTLVVIEADGSGEYEYDFSDEGAVIIDDVQWSPDGNQLLFTGYTDGWNTWDYFVVDSDGTNLVQLTNDGESGYGAWQPVPNTAPVLAAKTLSVPYETTGAVDVLSGSDDEEELEGTNISITAQPGHGSASVNVAQGKINYTPDDDYAGSDSLTYRICDSFTLDQKCSTAVLGITVSEPGAPVVTISKLNSTSVSPGGSYTSSTTKPTFSGTASPGAEITVEIHSDPIILTTTADNAGNWSITADQPIPPGQHTVTISATLDGQTTTLGSFILGIQDQLPNAGSDYAGWRYGGLGLVLGGLIGLAYNRRRRTNIPRLFP